MFDGTNRSLDINFEDHVEVFHLPLLHLTEEILKRGATYDPNGVHAGLACPLERHFTCNGEIVKDL